MSAALAGLIAVVWPALGSAQGTGQASRQAEVIRRARAAQNAAIVAGNVDSVATFWTDDVTIRRGLGQAASGRAAYRQLFVDTGNPPTLYQRIPDAVDVSSRWPLAFETGHWTGRIGGVTGTVAIRGRYSAQWVKRGERWLIRSEVYVALECGGRGCASQAAP